MNTLCRLALSPTLPRRIAWRCTETFVLVAAVGGVTLGGLLL